MRKPHSFINVVVLAVLIILLLARLLLGLNRYFDSDEFSHLHWAFLISQGQLPYRDIFIYHVPLFQLFLLPLFFLPASAFIPILARILMFVIYCLNIWLLYQLTKKNTGKTITALLTCVIMAVFPMTLDKSLEIRPDLLMNFFYLLGLLLLFSSFKSPNKLFLSCLSFGLSTLIFPKILFALPATFFLFLALLFNQSYSDSRNKKLALFSITLGFNAPFVMFFAYLSFNGLVQPAIQMIFYNSKLILGGIKPFSPLLALSPWPLVYVYDGGPSFPWLVNLGIWISALFGILVLFFKKPVLAIFSLLYFLVGFLVLFYFPTPYLQYFLPLSVFASLLAAVFISFVIEATSHFARGESIKFCPASLALKDCVEAEKAVATEDGSKFLLATSAGKKLKSPKNVLPAPLRLLATSAGLTSTIWILLFLIPLLVSFWLQFKLRYGNDHTEQLQVVRDVLAHIRPHETVYDMVGSYIFRPDGYRICCHPYADFYDALNPQPPTLSQSLTNRQTKFIVLDRQGLAFWLPKSQDLNLIISHYLPSRYRKIYSLGSSFKCTHSICLQYNVHGTLFSPQPVSSFEIIVPETYTITTQPELQTIIVDKQTIDTPVTLFLSSGIHTFVVPDSTLVIQVQLAR